ncbi:MAG: hypothetical protein F6K00_35085 [Leptolyngbya sp. SIOISBB]|nr:hypothetical protein [Leptolyngbya sp. SIOISBB]
MPFSTLKNAKERLQGYSFSPDLLAVEISENREKCIVAVSAYILPSMSEEEKEEIDCYFTEVIADYPHPYKLEEDIVEVLSISSSEIKGDIVFFRG